MAVYITEHSGSVAQERWSVGAPLATYALTSASTPTLPNGKTAFIRVTADIRSFLMFTVSTTNSPAVLTSTSYTLIIPANAAAERIAIPVGASSTGGTFRILGATTTT